MVRPLLLAEPGPGDASCTTWTLAVFIHLIHLQAGRPSSIFAVRQSSASQPPPSVFNQLAFFVWFRSYDPLRSLLGHRSSSFSSGLSTFPSCFRPADLLRSVLVFQPSLRASNLLILFEKFQSFNLSCSLPIS